MIKCPFCGSMNVKTAPTCESCGASPNNTITCVTIDLTGVKNPVQLAIAYAPVVVDTMLPSRLFELSFAGNTAVLTYRLPKPTKGFTAVVADNSVVVGGNVTGSSIVMGNNNTVDNNEVQKKKEPEVESIVIGIIIPDSIKDIIITGNGKTVCSVKCSGAQVTPLNAIVN